MFKSNFEEVSNAFYCDKGVVRVGTLLFKSKSRGFLNFSMTSLVPNISKFKNPYFVNFMSTHNGLIISIYISAYH